ncbi:hypothetical protein AB1Y20_012045 [Prymnesium parvum]|uniref:NAD(+) diphosphatase n=1 Tax=Prymnesium parvum TaxID=97485 RepID=A0AB34IQ42_PRYPA
MGLAARPGLRALLRALCNRSPRHAFAGHALSRPADSLLDDPAWVDAAMRRSLCLVFDSQLHCFARGGAPAWLPYAQLDRTAEHTAILLGDDAAGRAPLFAVGSAAALAGGASGGFSPLRSLASLASGARGAEALARAGQARNLLHWHARARFCGACGGRTAARKAGWKRECAGCGGELFPRVDPVVIMAVVSADGERVLLARQPSWPQQRYSCLAGFMDPGETLEEAVRREVQEEAGVSVAEVFYHSSQPWPCGPSPQLMLGALGIADTDTITPNLSEVADARWADRAEVAAAIDAARNASRGMDNQRDPNPATLVLPASEAIAHNLLAAWLEAPISSLDR